MCIWQKSVFTIVFSFMSVQALSQDIAIQNRSLPKTAAEEIQAALETAEGSVKTMIRDLRSKPISDEFKIADYRRITPIYMNQVETSLTAYVDFIKTNLMPKVKEMIDRYNSIYLSQELNDEQKRFLLDRTYTRMQNDLVSLRTQYQFEQKKLLSAQGDLPLYDDIVFGFNKLPKETKSDIVKNFTLKLNSVNKTINGRLSYFSSNSINPDTQYPRFLTIRNFSKNANEIESLYLTSNEDGKSERPCNFNRHFSTQEFYISGNKKFFVSSGLKKCIEFIKNWINAQIEYKKTLNERLNNSTSFWRRNKDEEAFVLALLARSESDMNEMQERIIILEEFKSRLHEVITIQYPDQDLSPVMGCESQMCAALRIADAKNYITQLIAKVLLKLELRTIDNRPILFDAFELDSTAMFKYFDGQDAKIKFQHLDTN